MIPVKWVDELDLFDDKETAMAACGAADIVSVVELAALTEVVEGIQRINEDMLAAGFDAPTDAQRLLEQLTVQP